MLEQSKELEGKEAFRWENKPNSEAGKWHTGLEWGEEEVRYPRKGVRKKRVRASIWRNPEIQA